MTRQYVNELPMPPFADDLADGGRFRTWLLPVGISAWHQGNEGQSRLAGGPYGFSHVDILNRIDGQIFSTRLSISEAEEAAVKAGQASERLFRLTMHRLTRPRKPYAGLDMSQYHIMGIINTTPDSFSDGGDHFEASSALASAQAMAEAGAVILDIGGESTRPGAEPVGYDEECRRILPVIETLSQAGHCVSADTRHSDVMEKALDHGAMIINDVGGLRSEGAVDLIAAKQAPAMIMHMQGEPGTMQNDPHYLDAPTEIFDWLENRINDAVEAGSQRSHLAIDPGFGFGKTPRHNMQIMQNIALFHGLGVPIVLGVSRKSTIAHYSNGEAAKDRVAGSVALAAMARSKGVQIFRVHDVAQTAQALANAEGLGLSLS